MIEILDCVQYACGGAAGARWCGGVASGEYPGIVSLRNKVKREHQRVRRNGGGRLGGDREYGAHRRRRISPVMPAEAADSGELLRCLGGVSGRKKKGGRRRTSGGFYRSGLDGQLVCGYGAGLTPASFRFQGERGNGGGDDADRWGPACQSGRWAPLSAGEGRECTDSGLTPGGPWARF